MSIRRASAKRTSRKSKTSAKRMAMSQRSKEWESDIILPKKLFPKPSIPSEKDEDEQKQLPEYFSWRGRGIQHRNQMIEFLTDYTSEPADIDERKRVLGEEGSHIRLFSGDKERGKEEAMTFIHDQLLLEGLREQDEINTNSINSLSPHIPNDAHPHNYFHYLFGRNPTDEDIVDAKHRLKLFQQRYNAMTNEDIARSRALVKKYNKNPILEKELLKDRYYREFKNKWDNIELEYEDNLSFVRGGTVPFDNMSRSAKHYLAWGDNPDDVYARAKKMVDGEDDVNAWNMVTTQVMVDGKMETITIPYPTLTPVNDQMNIDIQPHATYYTTKIRALERTLDDNEQNKLKKSLTDKQIEDINIRINTLRKEMAVDRDNIKVELFGGLDTKIIAPNSIKDRSFYDQLRKWVGVLGEEERSTSVVNYRYSVPEGYTIGSFDYLNTLSDANEFKKIVKGREGELDMLSFLQESVGSNPDTTTERFSHRRGRNSEKGAEMYMGRYKKRLVLRNRLANEIKELETVSRKLQILQSSISRLEDRKQSNRITFDELDELAELSTKLPFEQQRVRSVQNRRDSTEAELEREVKQNNGQIFTDAIPTLTNNEKWAGKDEVLDEMALNFMLPTAEEIKLLGSEADRKSATQQVQLYFQDMFTYSIYGYNNIRPTEKETKYQGRYYITGMRDVIWKNMTKEQKEGIKKTDVQMAVIQAHLRMRADIESETYINRLEVERQYHYNDPEVYDFLQADIFLHDSSDDDGDESKLLNLSNARADVHLDQEFNNIKREAFEKSYYEWAGKQKPKQGKLHDVHVVEHVGSVRGETLNGYIEFLRKNGFELTRPQITGVGRMTNSVGSIGFSPIMDEDDYGGNFVQHLRSVDRALTISHATKNSNAKIRRTGLRMLAEENHLIKLLAERGKDMPRVLSEASYPWLSDPNSEYLKSKTKTANDIHGEPFDFFELGEETTSFRGLDEFAERKFKKQLEKWYDTQRYDIFPDDMRILNSPMLVDMKYKGSAGGGQAVGYTQKTAKNQSFYFPPEGRRRPDEEVKATITHELLHQLGQTDFLTVDHEEAGTEIETFARTGILSSGYIQNPIREKEDLTDKLSMNGAVPITEVHRNPYLFVPQLAWNSTLWKRAFLQQVTKAKHIKYGGRAVLERVRTDGTTYFDEPTPQGASAPIQSALVKVEDDSGDVTVIHFNKGRTPFSQEEVKIALRIHDQSDKIMYDESGVDVTVINDEVDES